MIISYRDANGSSTAILSEDAVCCPRVGETILLPNNQKYIVAEVQHLFSLAESSQLNAINRKEITVVIERWVKGI